MLDYFTMTRYRTQLDEANRDGLLDDRAQVRALELLGEAPPPSQQLQRFTLWVAVTLIACAVGFFFAFNWAAMSPFAKFATLQTGIVGCLTLALWRGLGTFYGKLLALSAALLMGFLLAVFGQVYQTGADSAELFLTWAGAIFPLCLIARFRPLWFLWIIVLDLGVFLYYVQSGSYFIEGDRDAPFLVLAFTNALVYFFLHYLLGREVPRIALWASIVYFVGIPQLSWIAALEEPTRFQGLGLLAWGSLTACGYAYYRYARPDFHAVATVVLSVGFMATALVVRFIMERATELDIYASGLAIVSLAAGTVMLLYRIRATMGGES